LLVPSTTRQQHVLQWGAVGKLTEADFRSTKIVKGRTPYFKFPLILLFCCPLSAQVPARTYGGPGLGPYSLPAVI